VTVKKKLTKEDMIKCVIGAVTLLTGNTGKSLRVVCKELDLTYTSVTRWKQRVLDGRTLLKKSGPPKIPPLQLDAIENDIRELSHGPQRSQDTIQLYSRCKQHVSRRDFSRMVADIRKEANAIKRNDLSHVTWHKVGVAWAMDGTEYTVSGTEDTMHIQQVIELASHYHFKTISGHYQPVGEEIAGHLEHLISQHGTPLFLKRDNGGNQNHTVVNDVIEQHYIIPLNSPVYYAPYNGAVEKAQDELKKAVKRRLMYISEYPGVHFEAYTDLAAHDLNHRKKRSLRGNNSCQIYHDSRTNITFTKNERRDIYEWIVERSAIILDNMDSHNVNNIASAWRTACIMWLQKQNLITISKNKKVLPNFMTEIYHK
jgi:hypothetical protein